MVEYIDGSIIAQLGISDMRIPIQYALTYPERQIINLKRLDLSEIGSLTFEKPNREAFPCLDLAIYSLKEGGTMPTVLNGANEELVSLFLENKISFNDIPRYIEVVMNRHKIISKPNLEDIFEVDKWARSIVLELIK